jgi:Ca2+-binding EF-hand superfamily protein
MKRDNEKTGSNSKETSNTENRLGKLLQKVKVLFFRIVLNALNLPDTSLPLPKDQFVSIMVRLGVRSENAKQAFEILDNDHDGYLSAEEFVVGICGEASDQHVEMDPTLVQVQYVFFLKAFEVMGAAKDRDLTKDQFRTVMEQHGCPTGEADEIFSVLDADGGGSLSLLEFARGLTLRVGVTAAGPGFFDKIIFSILKRALKNASGVGNANGSVPLHMTTTGFENFLTKLGVPRETAKTVAQRTPTKNGSTVSIPKFLESLAVAQAGQVYELRDQILAHALLPEHEKALNLRGFADACVELGLTREDAYNLFDKVDKEKVGTASLRDLSTFLRDMSSKHRPHPAVAIQKVCFLIVFEKCDPEEMGEISEEAFCRMMSVNGVVRSVSLDVFRQIDVDQGRTVSLEEFARILAMDSASEERIRMVKSAILREAFNTFDIDRGGSISKEELWNGMRPYVSMEDVERIWKKLDHDGDGFISFPEFTRSLVYWATPVNDPRPAMAVKYALTKVLFNEVMGQPADSPTPIGADRGISEDAFVRYLLVLGTNRDDARRVFKSIDEDQSGVLDWNEFSHVFAMSDNENHNSKLSEGLQYAWKAVQKALWDRIFNKLEFTNTTSIGYVEFENAMKPYNISKSDLEYVYRWLDIDQSGDITLAEMQKRFCPR